MVVVMAVERGTSVISGVGLLYLDKYIYIYFFLVRCIREIECLPYADFFVNIFALHSSVPGVV